MLYTASCSFHVGLGMFLDMLASAAGDSGRRLAAFGYWAGYVGAALAVLHSRDMLPVPLRPTTVATAPPTMTSPPAIESNA